MPPPLLIWIEAVEAPPKRVERLEDHKDGKASPLREGEKKLLRFLCHNFLSAYSDNITNSFVCVCVCVREQKQEREAAHERQRESATERERQSREGGGSIFFHLTPPSPSNHRKEGPDPKLPIKSARGSRHYLSNKLLTDYMSRSLVLDWRKPLFFFLKSSYFSAVFPPSNNQHSNDFLTELSNIMKVTCLRGFNFDFPEYGEYSSSFLSLSDVFY